MSEIVREEARSRCGWAGQNPLMIEYHDREWGVPQHDDRVLFEFLILEGAQAGLSWQTVLNRRENYRRAFDNFEPAVIARYGEVEVARLLGDAGIIRNRLKVAAAITNAQQFLEVQEQYGSFDHYLWQFTDGQPIKNCFKALAEIPPHTPLSDKLSKDLQKRGFKFVGTTICYAFMQAVGMVNDHLESCFRYNLD
jgi:DNA-3-methyladenine glycosylase I